MTWLKTVGKILLIVFGGVIALAVGILVLAFLAAIPLIALGIAVVIFCGVLIHEAVLHFKQAKKEG